MHKFRARIGQKYNVRPNYEDFIQIQMNIAYRPPGSYIVVYTVAYGVTFPLTVVDAILECTHRAIFWAGVS